MDKTEPADESEKENDSEPAETSMGTTDVSETEDETIDDQEVRFQHPSTLLS